MRRPRILLADDHFLLLEGYRKLLEAEFDIVGEVDNGRALIEEAVRLQPDVVLLDISMPLLNGIDAARRLKEMIDGIRIVFVSMHDDPEYIRAAFEAGGSGYLLKRCASSELLTAVHETLRGHSYITPLISTEILHVIKKPASRAATAGSKLSLRQREVLQLIAEGHSAKGIARLLKISVKTVEFHKARIARELGVRSVAELTRYAVSRGLVGS
jgi:DNA-binding NarL/FixJ family response regulator